MISAVAFPVVLGLFLLLLVVLVLVVELKILRYAYQKIGVPARYMFVVLLLSLIGSQVNIPLYAMPVERLLPDGVNHRDQRGWRAGAPCRSLLPVSALDRPRADAARHSDRGRGRP